MTRDVLMVLSSPLQYNSAPASRAHQLAKYLSKSGLGVTLLGRESAADSITGREVLTVKTKCSAGLFCNLTTLAKVLYKSAALLASKNTGTLFMRGYDLMPLMLVAKLLRKKVIYDFHGYAHKEQMVSNRKARAFITRFFDTACISMADHITVISNTLLKSMPERHRAKCIVLPNGVDLDNFSAANQKDVLGKYGLPSGVKYACFIGNWEAWIAIDEVIKSSVYLDDGVRLVIIGKGANIDKWRRKYSNITFCGRLAHKETLDVLSCMDICICPYSKVEIAKNKSYRKVLEYLAAGKPIIASNAPSKEAFLKEDVNAVLYESGSIKSLAEKINFLASDDAFRKTLGSNNKNLSRKFGWESVIEGSSLPQIIHKTTKQVRHA